MAIEDILLAYIQEKQTSVGDQTEIDSISPDMVADIGIDLAQILRQILPTQNLFSVTAGSTPPTGGADTDLYFQSGLNQITVWRNYNGEWVNTAVIPTGLTSLVDGKLTGLRVALSGFVATVTDGSWILDNAFYSKATQTQFTLAPAHATLLRYDSIYANKLNQILIVAGAPSATPIAPDLPEDTLLVETITIPSVASGKTPFSDFAAVDISGKADKTYVDQKDTDLNNIITNLEAIVEFLDANSLHKTGDETKESGVLTFVEPPKVPRTAGIDNPIPFKEQNGKFYGGALSNTKNCFDILTINEINNEGDLNLEIGMHLDPANAGGAGNAYIHILFAIPEYYFGEFSVSRYPSNQWFELPISTYRANNPSFPANIVKFDIKRDWANQTYRIRARGIIGAVGSTMHFGIFYWGYIRVWFYDAAKYPSVTRIAQVDGTYLDVAAVTKIKGVTIAEDEIYDSTGLKFIKENNSGVVHTAGAETVGGAKNFTDLMTILNAVGDTNPVALGQYYNLLNTARYWRAQRKIPSIRILVANGGCYDFLKMIPTNNYVYCRITGITNSSVRSFVFAGGYDMTLGANGQWKELVPDMVYKDRTQDFHLDIRVIPDNGPTNSGIEFRARNVDGGTVEITFSLEFALALPSWQTNFEQFDILDRQYAWDAVAVPLYGPGPKMTLTGDGLNYVDTNGNQFVKTNQSTAAINNLQAQIDALANDPSFIPYTYTEYLSLSGEPENEPMTYALYLAL